MPKPLLKAEEDAQRDRSYHQADRQIEGIEKHARRMAAVRREINDIFSDISNGEFLQMARQQRHQSGTSLPNFSNNHPEISRYNQERTFLISRLVDSVVPDDQLHDYIVELKNLAVSILPSGNTLSPLDLRRWLISSLNLDQLRLYQVLITQWKARFMADIQTEQSTPKIVDLISVISDIAGFNNLDPEAIRWDNQQIVGLFAAFSDLYNFVYQLETQRPLEFIDRFFLNSARKVGLIFGDPEQSRLMMKLWQLYNQLKNEDSILIYQNWADAVQEYSRNHGLTAAKVDGLTQRLLPAMLSEDPQVKILQRNAMIWGVGKGDFGVGDFICHAYANPVTTVNLNELILISRSIPATSQDRVEQNRVDALTIDTVFPHLRVLIHDQKAHVHDLIVAMLHFFQSGDNSQLKQVLPRTDLNEATNFEEYLDRERYNKEVASITPPYPEVPVIEILTRLEENTRPVHDAAPSTTDEELNQLLLAVEHGLRDNPHSVREPIINALEYINQKLTTMIQNSALGIEPSYILALSWIERRTFNFLAKMKYEEQEGMYHQDWFSTILRFQELVWSPHFDEEKFRDFTQSVVNASSPVEAYKVIGTHIIQNVGQLALWYNQKGRSDTGALWSGNVAHELMSITDFKTAITEVGRRSRAERIRQVFEPHFHLGD